MRKNIHAFTECGHTAYPGYISVNQEEMGMCTIAARNRGGANVAVVIMTAEQLQAMARDILAHFPPPVVVEPVNRDPAAVTINGKKRKLPAITRAEGVKYFELCDVAGIERTSQVMTVTYSLPDGRSGSLLTGEVAPVADGAVYNLAVTGNA